MAESTALQKLSLDGNDLSMVPPEHVAKGTNRLQEVILLLFIVFVLVPLFCICILGRVEKKKTKMGLILMAIVFWLPFGM